MLAANPNSTPNKKRLACLTLLAITLLAAWLRLHRLADHNLWADEAFSINFAHLTWARFWKVSWGREGNMLLYYLLLRAWVHLGSSEFVVRLLSVIFGVAAVPMVYLLGRDLFSRATGMIAAALLAVHAFHIYFSQEARSYALLVLLLIASAWLFARFAGSPQRQLYRATYPLVSALAIYAHLFALLVIASQWLSWLALRLVGNRANEDAESPARPKWRQLESAISLTLLFSLPILAFALLKNKGQLNWIPPLTAPAFLNALVLAAGSGGLWLLALCLVFVLIAIIASLRSRSHQKAFAITLLLSWLLFPVAVFLLGSLYKPMFYSRYLILVVPALVLLEAQAVVVLKNLPSALRLLWIPALALVLGLSLRATWMQYDASRWPDWRAAAHAVSADLQAGDAVCFTGSGIDAFLYYWRREKNLDWNSLPGAPYTNGSQCFEAFPEQVASSLRYRRVWLITTDASPEQRAWIKHLFAPRFGLPVVQGPGARGIPTVELLPGAATHDF